MRCSSSDTAAAAAGVAAPHRNDLDKGLNTLVMNVLMSDMK
jgi:hypothetical protein